MSARRNDLARLEELVARIAGHVEEAEQEHEEEGAVCEVCKGEQERVATGRGEAPVCPGCGAGPELFFRERIITSREEWLAAKAAPVEDGVTRLGSV